MLYLLFLRALFYVDNDVKLKIFGEGRPYLLFPADLHSAQLLALLLHSKLHLQPTHSLLSPKTAYG